MYMNCISINTPWISLILSFRGCYCALISNIFYCGVPNALLSELCLIAFWAHSLFGVFSTLENTFRGLIQNLWFLPKIWAEVWGWNWPKMMKNQLGPRLELPKSVLCPRMNMCNIVLGHMMTLPDLGQGPRAKTPNLDRVQGWKPLIS